ncbi:MAG: hypothetical protein AAF243_14630 [Cyanobacteria bacterium P01_A01_bin.137]
MNKRGLGDLQESQSLCFLKSSGDKVVDILEQNLEAKFCSCNYGDVINISVLPGYLVYQFCGSNWTTIEAVKIIEFIASEESVKYPSVKIREKLSQLVTALGSEAVVFDFNNTTDTIKFIHFDSHHTFDSLSFDPYNCEDMDCEEQEQKAYAYVDDFLKLEGIYAFRGNWSHHVRAGQFGVLMSDSRLTAHDFSFLNIVWF